MLEIAIFDIEIYEFDINEFLNLTETPLTLGRFDLMRYEGTNFLNQARAAWYIPTGLFIYIILHYILCYLTKTCYKIKICRKIGIKIYK